MNPSRQHIGSICAGAFILHALNLLSKRQATTHRDAEAVLSALSVEFMA
ncbi:amidotransferase domain protein [Providencia alcalifaciens R90-1475]|nr:amidotransferase domain protein [Providencia alcalifaciens R90-1475]